MERCISEASSADGLPSWLRSALVGWEEGKEEGSACVVMLAGGGDATTVRFSGAWLPELRSCESECSVRGDTNSGPGAAAPIWARKDSVTATLAPDEPSAGLYFATIHAIRRPNQILRVSATGCSAVKCFPSGCGSSS